MLFNSMTFFMFLPAVYLAYRFFPHRLRNLLLLISSYIFYAWWDLRFLFLIVLSTAINYCCSIMLRDGGMTGKERAATSIWIILSYFFFCLIKWNYLAIAECDWGAMASWKDGWNIFLPVCAIILLFNLLYKMIVSLPKERKRTFFLISGISANLFILGFFKYFNFFIENIALLLKGLNIGSFMHHIDIILPIGISFYTFKGIGYVVDVYRGEIEPEHQYTNFALFIAFFPALLAGPIDRAKNLLSQISSQHKATMEQTLRGLHLIFYGLFKKVVIADGVVRTVNSVFGSTGHTSWIDVIVATTLFTLQIYCDFSGYTDIGRGTAKLFGIDLMINFKSPYFSLNPRQFWSRWHISLSTWLRDYLYIPLGGNRHGAGRTYINLTLTMVLGGLWHGAAWNFVLWGLYHGIVLCADRAIGSTKLFVATKTRIVQKVITGSLFFCITCYGWLIFRSPSLEKMMALSSTLFFDVGNMDFGAMKPRAAALLGLPVFLCIEIIENAANGKSFYQSTPTPVWTAIYAAMIFGLIIGMSTESAQFIYFNF
jgi:alginate O-acetyltransferase complex protein AlgI